MTLLCDNTASGKPVSCGRLLLPSGNDSGPVWAGPSEQGRISRSGGLQYQRRGVDVGAQAAAKHLEQNRGATMIVEGDELRQPSRQVAGGDRHRIAGVADVRQALARARRGLAASATPGLSW